MLVFCKIRAALGIMSSIISGGGSLAPHLDDFFEVCLFSVVKCRVLFLSVSSVTCMWPAESRPVQAVLALHPTC